VEREPIVAVSLGPGLSQTRAIALAALAIAVVALAVALRGGLTTGREMGTSPGAASLAMATCTGSLAESPDEEFWKIPLDKCDSAIDSIDVKSGFVAKWSICGGAKSFEVSLNPRAVIVSSDHIHCSSAPSEVAVTFMGPLKK
jgi:hypothetical protein